MGRFGETLNVGLRYFDLLHEDTDIRDHLSTFVDLCVELDAQTVIELGVRGGVSTVAWLHGLNQTGGTLWSVDISPAPPVDAAHWRFLQGDDLALAGELPDDVDIVFIDTCHYFDHTLRELETYAPKVREGGLIVLHDTELERPEGAPANDPPFPVKTAVELFCSQRDLRWTNNPACWGLAVVEVKHHAG